jgi:hypothetical protein|tara:strand:- start:37 stop:369 length:333 start_codon:yes stop_codon:yes gene_type:complete
VLKVVVNLVDAVDAVNAAAPTVLEAMEGIPRSKKFRLRRLDDLKKVRRRLLKRGRAIDAEVIRVFMGLVAAVGDLHKEVREKQKELGIVHKISSRQTTRVVKGRADAICK